MDPAPSSSAEDTILVDVGDVLAPTLQCDIANPHQLPPSCNSFDSENSDWAAPDIRNLSPLGAKHTKSAATRPDMTYQVRWMWDDEAVMPSLARLNPRRWTKWQSPEDAVISLENIMGSTCAERPLTVEVGSEASVAKSTSAANVAEAIVFVYRVMALQMRNCDSTDPAAAALASGPLLTLSTLAARAVDDTTINASRGAAVMRNVASRAARSVRSIGIFPKMSPKRPHARLSETAPVAPALGQIAEETDEHVLCQQAAVNTLHQTEEIHDFQGILRLDESVSASTKELADLASPCVSQSHIEPLAREPLNVSRRSRPASLTGSLTLSSMGLTSIMMDDTARVIPSPVQNEPLQSVAADQGTRDRLLRNSLASSTTVAVSDSVKTQAIYDSMKSSPTLYDSVKSSPTIALSNSGKTRAMHESVKSSVTIELDDSELDDEDLNVTRRIGLAQAQRTPQVASEVPSRDAHVTCAYSEPVQGKTLHAPSPSCGLPQVIPPQNPRPYNHAEPVAYHVSRESPLQPVQSRVTPRVHSPHEPIIQQGLSCQNVPPMRLLSPSGNSNLNPAGWSSPSPPALQPMQQFTRPALQRSAASPVRQLSPARLLSPRVLAESPNVSRSASPQGVFVAHALVPATNQLQPGASLIRPSVSHGLMMQGPPAVAVGVPKVDPPQQIPQQLVPPGVQHAPVVQVGAISHRTHL